MQKLLLSLSIVLCFVHCNTTKSSSEEKVVLPQKDMSSYYEWTHKAELAVVNQQFEQAAAYYALAQKEQNLFTRDAINGLFAAVEVRDYKLAAQFGQNLLEKGVPHSYFEKKEGFKGFVGSEEWTDLADVKPGINKHLKAKVDSLALVGAEFRKDYDFFEDTLKIINSKVKIELLDIWKKYGYPNDGLLGVVMENDTTIDLSLQKFGQLVDRQLRGGSMEFTAVLKESLEKGQLYHRNFAIYAQYLQPFEEHKLSCFYRMNKLFLQIKNELYTCCCEVEAEVNVLRAKYFLEPLAERRLKAEFHYEKDNRFGFGNCSLAYPTASLEMKDKLLEEGYTVYKKLETNKPYHKR